MVVRKAHSGVKMKLNANDIYERYSKAKSTADLWMNMFQQAYDYAMPNRAEFSIQKYTPGSSRTEHVYDPTAVIGLRKFAANMQNLLMPAGQNWAHFVPGDDVMDGKTDVDPEEAKSQCQKWENLVFDKLYNSNFQNAMYQSIMEMGISTGILLLNEGTRDDPLQFKSVPLHQVSLEPGPGDTVENVYRSFKLQARLIPQTWPKANLTQSILGSIKGDGCDEIDLIEGTIFVPHAKGKKKYCYFVMEEASKNFILKEYRDYSPWCVFRWNVYAGEVMGRGPIIDLLPFIKDLNKMAEFDLRAASYASNPIFLVASGSEVNPYTTRIQPGSLIPVQPNGVTQNPIQQLQITGTPTYSALVRKELEEAIQVALNINPVVPQDSGKKTATEVSMANAEWMRENQAMTGRFEMECNRPIIDKVWRILHKFGWIEPPYIDNKLIKVEFDTPVKEAQKTLEVQKAVQATQYMEQILGAQGASMGVTYGYDVEKVPSWILDQLDVDVDIVRTELSQKKMQQQVVQMQQQKFNQEQFAQGNSQGAINSQTGGQVT